MNKTVLLTNQETAYKAQAESHLAEAQRILRQLANERQREERRREERTRENRRSLLSEVKAILQHA